MSGEQQHGRVGSELRPSPLLFMLEGRAIYDAAGILALRPLFHNWYPDGWSTEIRSRFNGAG